MRPPPSTVSTVRANKLGVIASKSFFKIRKFRENSKKYRILKKFGIFDCRFNRINKLINERVSYLQN